MLTYPAAVHQRASLSDFCRHLATIPRVHSNPEAHLDHLSAIAGLLHDQTQALKPKISAILQQMMLAPASDDTKTTIITHLCAQHAFLRNRNTCHAILETLFSNKHQRYIDSGRPHHFPSQATKGGLCLQSYCICNNWQDTLDLIQRHQAESPMARQKIQRYRSLKDISATLNTWFQDGVVPVLYDTPRYLRLISGHFLNMPVETGEVKNDTALAWLKSRLDIDPTNKRLYFSANNVVFLLQHPQYITALSPEGTTQSDADALVRMLRAPRPQVTWIDDLLGSTGHHKIDHTLHELAKASCNMPPHAQHPQMLPPYPDQQAWLRCWFTVKRIIMQKTFIQTIELYDDKIKFLWQGDKDQQEYTQFLYLEKLLLQRHKPGQYYELHKLTDTQHIGIAKTQQALSRIFTMEIPWQALQNLSPLELTGLTQCCAAHPSWLIHMSPQQAFCMIALPLTKHFQPANRAPIWYKGSQTAAESAAVLSYIEHASIRDIMPDKFRFLDDKIRLKTLVFSIEESQELIDAYIFPDNDTRIKQLILSVMLQQRINAFINPYKTNCITWQHYQTHAVMNLKSVGARAQWYYAIISAVIKSKAPVAPSLKSVVGSTIEPPLGEAVDNMITACLLIASNDPSVFNQPKATKPLKLPLDPNSDHIDHVTRLALLSSIINALFADRHATNIADQQIRIIASSCAETEKKPSPATGTRQLLFWAWRLLPSSSKAHDRQSEKKTSNIFFSSSPTKNVPIAAPTAVTTRVPTSAG